VVIGHGNSRARGVENALLGIARTGAGLTVALEGALTAAHASAAGEAP
jgi:glycerol-3-phosphate acyltransferase PlsX